MHPPSSQSSNTADRDPGVGSSTSVFEPGLPLSERSAGAALDPRFVRKLQKIVGARYVLARPEERYVYESDACLLMNATPDVVVLPRTTEEVSQVVRLCHDSDIPFVARGAGTGLSGGALAIEGGVIIGLNRMNRILSVDPQRRFAWVEVGIVNARLNESLGVHNLFYAPDPSSQSACTLGGNMAENAGGIHCIKYGVTTDHILAAEVVMADGDVMTLGHPNRRTHGLNLLGVMVGSEGTMGVMTKACIRLLPKPEAAQVYLAAFAKTEDATDTVTRIIGAGLNPAALEFMDAFTMRAVNQAFNVGFPETSEAVLLIELDGHRQVLDHLHEKLMAILEAKGPELLRVATSPEERKTLWKARKLSVAAYGRLMPAFYLHDCVIPRSQLTTVLAKIQEISQARELMVGNVFHAGDGNLHPNILFDPEDRDMVARMLQGGEEILEACLAVGGTLSGEHGVGIEKAEFMDRVFSPIDLAVMQRIKHVFDPKHRCNPGKIFPHRRGCGEGAHGLRDHDLVARGMASSPETVDPEQIDEGGMWI